MNHRNGEDLTQKARLPHSDSVARKPSIHSKWWVAIQRQHGYRIPTSRARWTNEGLRANTKKRKVPEKVLSSQTKSREAGQHNIIVRANLDFCDWAGPDALSMPTNIIDQVEVLQMEWSNQVRELSKQEKHIWYVVCSASLAKVIWGLAM